ncbi:MAG: hypothetical protein N6V49_02700 [Serratia symbiotica]|nr:hypothetical protein [Serratia symbiotica]
MVDARRCQISRTPYINFAGCDKKFRYPYKGNRCRIAVTNGR